MPKKLAICKIVIFTSLFASILFLHACKKDENNNTPAKEVFNSNFYIYEHWKKIPIAWEEYDTDTLLTQSVKLKAEVENGMYEWDINGIKFATREIILDSIPFDSLLKVKYKVSKNGETDSLTRSFIRLPDCNTLVHGVFTGKISGSNSIRKIEFDTKTNCKIIRGKGLSKDCSQNFPVSYIGYKQVAFASTTDPNGIGICFDPIGMAYYNTNNNELTVKFKLKSSPSSNTENVFVGAK